MAKTSLCPLAQPTIYIRATAPGLVLTISVRNGSALATAINDLGSGWAFVGTSANALKIQIWTALIAILLLRYLKLRARWGWSLSNLVALLRQQLFVHRELFAWLDEPFHPPPGSEPEPPRQLLLTGMEA